MAASAECQEAVRNKTIEYTLYRGLENTYYDPMQTKRCCRYWVVFNNIFVIGVVSIENIEMYTTS